MRLNLGSGKNLFVAFAALAAVLAGCSRGEIGALNVERLGYSFSVEPAQKLLAVGNAWTFTASGGNAPYLYTLESGGGQIDPVSGRYVAPPVPGVATIWVADSTGRASTALVIINPALSISAAATSVDVSGTVLFSAAGGVPPYSFAVAGGGGTIHPQSGSYTAPAAEGSATIRVTDSLGNLSETTVLIEDIIPPPTLTGLNPTAGPLAGGTLLTISGADFQSGAIVTIGGTPCSVAGKSTTAITCTTAPKGGGTYDVVVTNPDGQSATLTGGYTYQPPPGVTGVSPLAGPASGGTVITVSGTGFVAGALVKVGAAACGGVTVVSPGELTCTTPTAAAGSYTVTVRNSDGQQGALAGAFTYQPAPAVSAVEPAAGALAGGTTLTITGDHFVAGATVQVGSVSCSGVTVDSSTQIRCSTGANFAGTYAVKVTNPDGQKGEKGSAFTHQAGPAITSVTPDAGALAGSTTISIKGSGFQGSSAVRVGGILCDVSSASSELITCVTRAKAAGTYDVVVINADLQSAVKPGAYTYQAAPSVQTVSPSAGALAGGTQLTITGTNFRAGATAEVGSVDCGNVIIDSPTQVRCTTGASSAGTYAVSVRNTDDQEGEKSAAFTYQEAPKVTAVSPPAGALAGGTTLTVTGEYFLSGATVKVGAAECGSVQFDSSTQLRCSTGANSQGTYGVKVTNPDGQQGVKLSAFTHQPGPVIASITPGAGALAGSTTITIAGSGFQGSLTVMIGGTPCDLESVLGGVITCRTRAKAPGTYDVVVTNPDAQAATEVGGYTYQPSPAVTNVVPSSGPLAGGTVLTITGTGFLSDATVYVGTVECGSVEIDSSTQLRCTTGSGAAGTYSVVVTNTDGQEGAKSAAFSYQAAPDVTGVTPGSGPAAGGTSISISGSGFQEGATVAIGGAACNVNSVTESSIICITTAMTGGAAGTYDVVVTNPDGQQGSKPGAFTYVAAPDVTGVTPGYGPASGGTSLSISGSGFQEGATVSIGGASCTSGPISASSITCTTTAKTAGTYDVVVTNPDGQQDSEPNVFTYEPAPQVTSVTPTSGPQTGGTSITIAGSHFHISGSSVTIGGVSCVVTGRTATAITCTTGAKAPGTYDVVVTNPDSQQGTKTDGFTYLAPAPVVNSISPELGPSSGETTVRVTGTNFRTGAQVLIGGVLCNVTALASNQLDCTTGASTKGTYGVTVRNDDDQEHTLAGAYTYRDAPTVSDVSPSSGSVLGSTAVTITGTNFFSGALVKVGGVDCSGVTVISSMQIQCVTGAHSVGSVAIYIENTEGQSVTSGAIYSYQAGPTVSMVSPASGSTAGGTTLTITGTGFAEGAQVMLGASDCNMVSVNSSTQLTCVAPSHGAGSVGVTVINPDSASDTKANGFSYITPSLFRLCTHSSSADSGGTLADDGGPAGNYGLNKNCGFVINGAGRPITLTFTSFRTEENVDFVDVHDGVDISGPALHTGSGFTGSTIPLAVTARTGNMFIRLRSGGSGVDQGFVASWVTAPAGSPVGSFVLSDTTPAVDQPVTFNDTSTGGPQAWAWDFNSDGAIDSTDPSPFYAFASPGMNVISLTVTNGSGASTVKRAVWVSTYSMTEVVSTADRAGVLFDSGGLLENYPNGANQSFTIAPGLGPIRLELKDLNLANFDYLKVYDGTSAAGTALHGGPGFTGSSLPGSLWALSGTAYIVFTSDGGENKPGFRLDWSAAPAGAPAARFSYGPANPDVGQSMSFSDLSTESPTEWEWDFENDGSVDSMIPNPTHVYPTIGEREVRLTVRNANGSSTIIRKVNVATYTLCSPAAEMTALNAAGMVYDPGGSKRDYMESKICGLLIQPAGGASSITLTFSSFVLEMGGVDFLDVYDGVDTLGTVLTSSSGTATPAPVTATSGSMYILFSSDSSKNFPGFAASWTSTP